MVAALPEGIPLLQYVELRAGDDTPSDEEQLAIAVMCNRGAIVDLFHSWDLDRDGVLSKEEGLSVLTSLAADASAASGGGGAATVDAETLDRLFNLLDAAGDGVVDFNEFLAMRRQLQL